MLYTTAVCVEHIATGFTPGKRYAHLYIRCLVLCLFSHCPCTKYERTSVGACWNVCGIFFALISLCLFMRALNRCKLCVAGMTHLIWNNQNIRIYKQTNYFNDHFSLLVIYDVWTYGNIHLFFLDYGFYLKSIERRFWYYDSSVSTRFNVSAPWQ